MGYFAMIAFIVYFSVTGTKPNCEHFFALFIIVYIEATQQKPPDNSEMLKALESLKEKILGIEENIPVLNRIGNDVSRLKKKVSGIKKDVSDMKSELRSIKDKIDEVSEKSLEILQSEFNIYQKMAGVLDDDDDDGSIYSAVLRLAKKVNEISDKLDTIGGKIEQ